MPNNTNMNDGGGRGSRPSPKSTSPRPQPAPQQAMRQQLRRAINEGQSEVAATRKATPIQGGTTSPPPRATPAGGRPAPVPKDTKVGKAPAVKKSPAKVDSKVGRQPRGQTSGGRGVGIAPTPKPGYSAPASSGRGTGR